MIAPMLSKLTEVLPSGKDFIYEIKLDGQRTIAEVSKTALLLYTRNFQNVTNKYPELEILKKCITKKSAILDGEIVALKDGIPSFELLQQRMNLRDMRAVRRAVEEIPVIYYIFDILDLDGKSLLKEPFLKRKQFLEKAVKPCDVVKLVPHFDSRDLIVKMAGRMGYEGVVAKSANSLYYPGKRTDCWQKYKFHTADSFVIGGWTEGGRSQNFGSLLIGQYKEKDLIPCGRAGTGFNEKSIRMLLQKFQTLKSPKCPFPQVPKTGEIVHWLKPKLVAEVKFNEWTQAGNVRAPVFMGLREDLTPQDCKLKNRR